MTGEGDTSDEETNSDRGSSAFPSFTLNARAAASLKDSIRSVAEIRRQLEHNRGLRNAVISARRAQQTIDETIDISAVQRVAIENREALMNMQKNAQDIAQHVESTRPAINSLQQVSGILQAYNENISGMYDTLYELREDIRVAVEEQIELEMPGNYESVEPHPTAKTVAEQWTEQFIEDLEETEDEYFSRVVVRMRDGLEDYRREPEHPYAAIHIFISMQDALLWCLCYQDEEISSNGTSEAGLEKYKTKDKQKALRKNYQSYFGVERDDTSQLSEYKWNCFWAHRHAIMHGDIHATYDMNIATTALLFFALTANSVLKMIQEILEQSNDTPSIFESILEEEDAEESNSNVSDSFNSFDKLFD